LAYPPLVVTFTGQHFSQPYKKDQQAIKKNTFTFQILGTPFLPQGGKMEKMP
jgi:hypothetical protein